MDPLRLFFEDRARARELGDPMANLCSVANVDALQQPQLRTLVLRDFDGGLAIFVNATSPKWPYLRAGSCAVLTYWPSVQVQYRLQARTEPLPASSVAASWQLRPDSPKRMDWLYEQVAGQSTPIDSRDALLAHFEATELPDPLVASPSAMGLFLQPESVERLDLTQSNGVHDRRRYVRDDGQWREQTLIP